MGRGCQSCIILYHSAWSSGEKYNKEIIAQEYGYLCRLVDYITALPSILLVQSIKPNKPTKAHNVQDVSPSFTKIYILKEYKVKRKFIVLQ